MSKKVNPVGLCILDGWGENTSKEYNAVKLADAPNLNRIINDNKHTLIRTDGEFVGLPEGQMGNSEVGHTNIGAGRVVFQTLPKINKAIKSGEFANNKEIQKAIEIAKSNNSTVHIMGLFSEGGIHSTLHHYLAAVEVFAKEGLTVKMHSFTDGRDTPPESSAKFFETAENFIKPYPSVEFATVIGRYYAMDRDKRWERTELAYNALVLGKAETFNTPLEAIKASYKEQEAEGKSPSDEFVKPSVIKGYEGMKDNDVIFMINYRADRARQILNAMLDPSFNGFKPEKIIKFSCALAMANYSVELDKLTHVVFPHEDLKNTLGETISKHGLKQLHMAETEKYPHVTFFFNGGLETPFSNEDRILIPSPKVATYDLKPEMSAYELTDKLLEAINSKQYDLIVVNYANGDMVGHTGILEAAIKAVEALDKCIEKVEKAIKQNGYTLIVTADHGNCENEWDFENNAPHTQHTTNPVQFIVVNAPTDLGITALKEGGKLADIAPTILSIMGIEKPVEMTGNDLLIKK